MSGYHGLRAGSQTAFNEDIDINWGAYSNAVPEAYRQQQPSTQQYPQAAYIRCPAEYNAFSFAQIPEDGVSPQDFVHQQHLSSMSYSSGSAGYRSSDNSAFSQWPIRDSVSSSTSSWSHASGVSRSQCISETEHSLIGDQPFTRDSLVSPSPKRRSAQRQTVSEKDYYKTCVSTHKQSRPCKNEHKYFCTICKKTFVSKADWKRHEETYQERAEKYQCDLCSAIYFLDKDFVAHHVKSHRCASCADSEKCSRKRHVQEARQKRRTRSGWGCGFCCHFSNDWVERCNHIAHHLEREGKTAANWYHSRVIYSLLQRPEIQIEWNKLVKRSCGQQLTLAWNQHSTGRAEGYPETNRLPQLQDLLECFTPDQNAAAIATLAFDKLAPPPVPPKDDREALPMMEVAAEDPWLQMINTIIADTMLPADVDFLENWRVDL